MEENKGKLLNFIFAVSTDFNHDLNELQAEGYLMALEDLQFDHRAARKKILKTFDKMPSVKQICDLLDEKIKLPPRQAAISLVDDLISAIEKFGYTADYEKEVRPTLSVEAQVLCQKLGRWTACCRYPFKKTSSYAQARDIAETVIISSEQLQDKTELLGANPGSRMNRLTDSLNETNSMELAIKNKKP